MRPPAPQRVSGVGQHIGAQTFHVEKSPNEKIFRVQALNFFPNLPLNTDYRSVGPRGSDSTRDASKPGAARAKRTRLAP
jgi:hypothetical protein